MAENQMKDEAVQRKKDEQTLRNLITNKVAEIKNNRPEANLMNYTMHSETIKDLKTHLTENTRRLEVMENMMHDLFSTFKNYLKVHHEANLGV